MFRQWWRQEQTRWVVLWVYLFWLISRLTVDMLDVIFLSLPCIFNFIIYHISVLWKPLNTSMTWKEDSFNSEPSLALDYNLGNCGGCWKVMACWPFLWASSWPSWCICYWGTSKGLMKGPILSPSLWIYTTSAQSPAPLSRIISFLGEPHVCIIEASGITSIDCLVESQVDPEGRYEAHCHYCCSILDRNIACACCLTPVPPASPAAHTEHSWHPPGWKWDI